MTMQVLCSASQFQPLCGWSAVAVLPPDPHRKPGLVPPYTAAGTQLCIVAKSENAGPP